MGGAPKRTEKRGCRRLIEIGQREQWKCMGRAPNSRMDIGAGFAQIPTPSDPTYNIGRGRWAHVDIA